MTDWKPGFRHQVREATGYDQWWRHTTVLKIRRGEKWAAWLI